MSGSTSTVSSSWSLLQQIDEEVQRSLVNAHLRVQRAHALIHLHITLSQSSETITHTHTHTHTNTHYCNTTPHLSTQHSLREIYNKAENTPIYMCVCVYTVMFRSVGSVRFFMEFLLLNQLKLNKYKCIYTPQIIYVRMFMQV